MTLDRWVVPRKNRYRADLARFPPAEGKRCRPLVEARAAAAKIDYYHWDDKEDI
jgi:hypothetical protein